MTHPTAKAGHDPTYPCGHPRTDVNTLMHDGRKRCRRCKQDGDAKRNRMRRQMRKMGRPKQPKIGYSSALWEKWW